MKQPLAYVHPEAKIAPNVVIEPFVTIDKNVVIRNSSRPKIQRGRNNR